MPSREATLHRRSSSSIRRLQSLVERPSLVLGAIVFASAGLAAFFSLQVVRYEPDELGYTHLAMGIARSWLPFTSEYGGGARLNQLYPLLIAPLWGAFGNVTAFRLSHAWNALLMASATIPVYLLAREVVRERWVAYLAAALAAVAPWLTLSTGQLTEVAAYPACAWALLAMQRALAAPSARRDTVALVAIALGAYGRLQLLVLAPVLVLAMLLHEFGYALRAPERSKAALSDAAKRIARRHTVLVVASIGGGLAFALLLTTGKLASAAGFYGDTVNGVTLNGATFDLARSYFAFIALGLGVLPALLASGFVFEALVAPGSRRAHALASLTAISVLAIILQVAEVSVRFNGGTMQERYAFFIVPLLIVCMCASLLGARHPGKLVLGGTLVVALLIGTTHYPSLRTAFWYQTSPGMASFYDWVRPLFGAAKGPTANPGADSEFLAGLVVLCLGVALAALTRRWSPTGVLACAGTAAVVFCAAETTHAFWRVVHGNAGGGGLGGSVRGADWIDRSVPAGTSVQQWVAALGGLDTARRTWEDDDFWNRSLTAAYTLESFGDPYLPTTKLSLDTSSGALQLASAPSTQLPSPRYLVVSSRGLPVQPAGEVLDSSPDRTLQLIAVSPPLRAAWAVFGSSADGWLRLYRPATLRLYALRATRHCDAVAITLSLPRLAVTNAVTMKGAGRVLTVTVDPGQTRTVGMRACGAGTAAVPQVLISAHASAGQEGSALGPQLQRIAVTPT